jgi:gliding motility-associated-like protein
MKLFFRIFFLLISFNLTYAQSPDCATASAMCSGQGGPYLNTHTGTPGGNQAGYGPITACGGSNSHGNNGSLGSTPRPAWFYFQIGQSGPIDLNIQQFNTSNTGIDVDFALWGPFSSNNLADICNSLSGFPGTTYTGPCNLVDASYSTTFNETIHFPNAVAGEFYLLLVTNFSGAQGTYTINQVNVTPSSGQISCDIVCGIDLGPDQLFCSSTINNFNLVANYIQAPTVVGTPTFSWYLHNGTSFVLQTTTTTNTLNVNQDGIWKVAVVRPGCSDLAEDEIEIRFDSPPSPNQPDNLEAPAGLCEYTFDLTSVEIDLLSPALPADYVIKYYLNEPDCFIGNANFIPNPTAFTVTTTTTIYVRIENIGNAICADANQFFDLVIDCIPASCFLNLTSAPATTNQSICIGQPIQNITYTYGDDATNVTATGLPTGLSFSTSAGVVTISGTPTQMGTFNYQLETVGCTPSIVKTGTITINSLPNVTSLTSNSPICLGQDAVFTINGTAGATVGYTINGGAPLSTTLNATGQVDITVTAPTADVTLVLSNVSLGTCSTTLTNSATVIVKPVPDVTSITSNTPICSGEDAEFVITGTTDAVVTYSLNGGTPTTTTLTGGTATISIPNAQSNQQLEVTLVAYNGCSNIESYNETIVVNTTPTVSSLTSNSPICLGSDAVFTINGTAGADVSYTINSGATLTATLTSGQAVITIPAPTADVTILLSEVVLGSCSKTVTNTATVVVKPLPTVTSLITNSPICSGNTATFTINGTPNAVVTYSLNGATATTTTLSATGVGTVSLTNATSNVSISLSLVNNGTCSTPLNLTENINVLALPVVTNLTSNSPICSGEDAEFTITGTANSIVSYSLNGTTTTVTLNASGNSIVPISNATVNQTISLSNVFDGNCNNVLTNTATVIVNALPSSPTIASISETYCIGEEMVFNVTGGNATETVTYTVNGGANQILNLDASGNGVITLSNPAAVVVIDLVSITNGSCSKSLSASDEAEVISCEIPKGISPGNDNKNDEWDLTGYNVKKVEIFNRYGTKVYSKTNYTNEWKGQSDNGNELPDGTYYYVVEFNQGPTKTGWVYINREQ